MIIDSSIKEFISCLKSDAPAPGGGSVAAVVSSMAISLTLMATRISIKRKSFNEYDEDIKSQIHQKIDRLEELLLISYDLADKDIATFSNYMSISKTKDRAKIEEATKECFAVPYELSGLCLLCSKEIFYLKPYIVDSIISDLNMSLVLLSSCLKSCLINMKINLKYLDDSEIVDKYLTQEEQIKEFEKQKDIILGGN